MRKGVIRVGAAKGRCDKGIANFKTQDAIALCNRNWVIPYTRLLFC
jgi:hypothetical protein